jgi:hypothetical protein
MTTACEETNAQTGQVKSARKHMPDNPTFQSYPKPIDLLQMNHELIDVDGGAVRFVAAMLSRELGFQRNS